MSKAYASERRRLDFLAKDYVCMHVLEKKRSNEYSLEVALLKSIRKGCCLAQICSIYIRLSLFSDRTYISFSGVNICSGPVDYLVKCKF